MELQRPDDIACLLALLMLPACSDADDGTVGDPTAGGPSTATDGGMTDSADAETSSGLGASSSDGPESSASVDDTATPETTGGVRPLCEAYAENIENCHPDNGDPTDFVQQCEMAFDEYATYGQACLDAAEALYMCRAEASCEELERDSCFPLLNTVVGECG